MNVEDIPFKLQHARSNLVMEGFSQGFFLLVLLLRIGLEIRIREMLQDTSLMNPISEQDPQLIINQSLLWDVVTEGKVNDRSPLLHPAYKINH